MTAKKKKEAIEERSCRRKKYPSIFERATKTGSTSRVAFHIIATLSQSNEKESEQHVRILFGYFTVMFFSRIM
jgi:hypothetical protein